MTHTCRRCGAPPEQPCRARLDTAVKLTLVQCDICQLTYDEPAYQAHRASSCEHGIRPMLACNLHDIECPYSNPVWRYQNNAEWMDKDRLCRPLYQFKTHYRYGMYLTLYEPPWKEKAKAPRPPKKERECK